MVAARRFPEAISVLETELDSTPQDQVSLHLLAQCHEWNADYNQALRVADRVLAVSPDDRDVLSLAARSAVSIGDSALAYQYAARLVDLPIYRIGRPPNWLLKMLRPIENVFGLTKRRKSVVDAIARANRRQISDYDWAKQYCANYERNQDRVDYGVSDDQGAI